MTISIINGPNMNLLGVREPNIYGKQTYADLVEYIKAYAKERGVTCRFFQSNHEGAIIDKIQEAMKNCDGIVINPAAYTHTSVAIADAIRAVGLPTVEVHISDVNNREDFRKLSFVRDACVACIAGKGFDGYTEAVEMLLKRLEDGKS